MLTKRGLLYAKCRGVTVERCEKALRPDIRGAERSHRDGKEIGR